MTYNCTIEVIDRQKDNNNSLKNNILKKIPMKHLILTFLLFASLHSFSQCTDLNSFIYTETKNSYTLKKCTVSAICNLETGNQAIYFTTQSKTIYFFKIDTHTWVDEKNKIVETSERGDKVFFYKSKSIVYFYVKE